MYIDELFKLSFLANMNIYAQKGIRFFLYIIIAILSYKVIKFFFYKIFYNKLSRRYFKENKIRVILSIGVNVFKYTIYFITILVILRDVFNVNTAVIITATGVLGLAFGFGIQGLLRDFISGISILFENQFDVGDYVEILNIKGKVIDINIKNTKIKESNGSISIISNGIINRVIRHKGNFDTFKFYLFVPKANKMVIKVYNSIVASFRKNYETKIKSFNELHKNFSIGKLNYYDFILKIEPFNEHILDAIENIFKKNISDIYIYRERV